MELPPSKTVREVMAVLGVSMRTVRYLVAPGGALREGSFIGPDGKRRVRDDALAQHIKATLSGAA